MNQDQNVAKKRVASEKAPAYQWYPKDYETDTDVILMTGLQEYAYRRLLDRQWLEGSIPSDPRLLALLVPKCGSVEYFVSDIWPLLSRKFVPREGGEGLINLRVERQRSEQAAFLQERAESGAKGAAVRWGSDDPQKAESSSEDGSAKQQPSYRDGSAIKEPLAKNASPSPSPTAFKRENGSETEPQGAHVGELSGTTDLTLAKRAAHFCDDFATLFKKYRNGATYHARRRNRGPDDDYQAALGLCSTFSSDRLTKLVKVFMNSDEPYIARSDHGIAVFERKASWCDDMLRQSEAKQMAKFPRSA